MGLALLAAIAGPAADAMKELACFYYSDSD
jgi:hypothetical protein